MITSDYQWVVSHRLRESSFEYFFSSIQFRRDLKFRTEETGFLTWENHPLNSNDLFPTSVTFTLGSLTKLKLS